MKKRLLTISIMAISIFAFTAAISFADGYGFDDCLTFDKNNWWHIEYSEPIEDWDASGVFVEDDGENLWLTPTRTGEGCLWIFYEDGSHYAYYIYTKRSWYKRAIKDSGAYSSRILEGKNTICVYSVPYAKVTIKVGKKTYKCKTDVTGCAEKNVMIKKGQKYKVKFKSHGYTKTIKRKY